MFNWNVFWVPSGAAFESRANFSKCTMAVSTVGSWYCHDLVTAMVHLLKFALDSKAAPEGTQKTFQLNMQLDF
jgi:hypothetical protein